MKRVAIKCVPETIQRGADHVMYGRKGCRTEGCQDSMILVGNGVSVSYDATTGCGPSADLTKSTKEAATACLARMKFLTIGRLGAADQLGLLKPAGSRNKLSNLVSALAGGIC